MLSRRKFLQTNAAALAVPIVSTRAPGLSNPVGSQAPAYGPAPERAYWNDWPTYLTAKMNEARARRKAALASLSTPAQVQERVQMIRKQIWNLIGGPFESTPLNPVVAGTIARKTYRIEKVIFESQPQVYVTAHLYIPTTGVGPFPGVLAPLGHSPNGKSYRNYQYAFQTLARKGYVVLAYDPFGQGERYQYLDPRTGQPRYSPTGEHSQAGRPLLLLGATFAQYRVWDGIRALDYLLSRPEVDRNRIGCIGQSGGGTLTMYLCALEPRIQAAVEVQGNSENLAGPGYDPPGAVADAEQNLAASLPLTLDRGDLLAAFAPKPLLICYTPHDAGTTYSPAYVEGTKEIFDELKACYRIMRAEDRVELFTSPLPHGLDFFTRRAAYAWFNRWLGKADQGTEESEFDDSTPESLNCTSTGQVLTSLGGRSAVQVTRERAHEVGVPSPIREAPANPQDLRRRIREQLQRLLALSPERSPLQPRVLSRNVGRGVVIEEIEFSSEPSIRVPGWFLKPETEGSRLPTVLYVAAEGKNRSVGEPREADALVRRGYAFCAIDLRGLGITAPRPPAAGPLFYQGEHADDGFAWASLTLGRPVAGQRVKDFLRSLDYLETRPDVDASRIYIVGTGSAGLAALLGTALDDRPRSLLLHRTLGDFRSLLDSEEYSLPLAWFVLGFLRQFDLPDLAGSLVPRPCWILNACGPRGERLAISTVEEMYRAALDYYDKNGAQEKLRFLVRPDEERAKIISSWLENS